MKMELSNVVNIFPKPKRCEVKEGFVAIGEAGKSKCYVLIEKNAAVLEVESANLLIDKIGEKIGKKPELSIYEKRNCDDIVIKIRTIKCSENDDFTAAHKGEGYYLDVANEEIHAYGIDEKGTFYAVQTLIQILCLEGNDLSLPLARIEDWPDIKHRGLFLENRYGTDLMTLDDWKETIDYMASLKLNFLGIGVYGCWCIQYNNQVSEYWYLPIAKYTNLNTANVIMYYSPAKMTWVTLEYLPEMFKGDFFGEIIAYGKKRNVTVRPNFSSMGHNTLIPRLYPETSAKDESGNPTGYSFCTSCEQTYKVLFDIYDEIIDKYLAPNGIDWFHIGLDEVVKIVGVDPRQPHKEIDPWCKCELCSVHTHEEIFIDHVIKVVKHLKAKGLSNISMWHDQLEAMHLLNENLVKRLEKEELLDSLILNWWEYGTQVFETTRPELGIRRFVTPMTGYCHWVLSSSCLQNIHSMSCLAHKESAEGVEAYSSMDYSYDRNYCCLSEYTWNSTDSSDLKDFRSRYIRWKFPNSYKKAEAAFEHYDRLVEPGEKRDLLMWTLSYYLYTYVKEEKDYPRNFPGEVFTNLFSDFEKNKSLLEEVYDDSSKAYALFGQMEENMQFDHRLIMHYIAECLNYKVLANEYLKLMDINEKWNCTGIADDDEKRHLFAGEIIDVIENLIKDREKLMLVIEKNKEKYLLPSELRNLSIHRQYLIDLKSSIKQHCQNSNCVETKRINFTDTRNIESRIFTLLR